VASPTHNHGVAGVKLRDDILAAKILSKNHQRDEVSQE
jgi:hypothetical protein